MTLPTARQRDVHAFMIAYRDEHTMWPTVREICAEFGWRSSNAARSILRTMERNGLISAEVAAATRMKHYTALERFVAKTTPANNDKGCIFWTGAKALRGYGRFFAGADATSRLRSAHGWIYEHHHGPIPVGLMVLHSCDEPACVNIEHLSLGKHVDNMADMVARGRAVKGADVAGAVLTEATVRKLRARYLLVGHIPTVAKEFGVNRTTAHSIITRKSWRHIP